MSIHRAFLREHGLIHLVAPGTNTRTACGRVMDGSYEIGAISKPVVIYKGHKPTDRRCRACMAALGEER